MTELVVCSGKGGTGKTSVVAGLAALADDAVLADCDVDAADLHLVLDPAVERRQEFRAGHEARIRVSDCSGCAVCQELCRFEAIAPADDGETFVVDPLRCEGCGVCVRFCPDHAIDFPERTNGEWFVSRTRHGPLVHARLTPGGENSGKLVTLVRERAREIARESGRDLLIVDGPPGIGCPVIAALADATVALVVTEPTQAALHDLRRVVELARYFDIPAWVCINKHDLAAEMQRHIEAYCELHDLPIVGKIPYDPQITAAQIARTSVVELDSPPSAIGLRAMWARVKDMLP